MSRYTHRISRVPNVTFNFGYDHALGYFYDKFDEDDEESLEEKCSLFDNLTGPQLAEVVIKTMPDAKTAYRTDKVRETVFLVDLIRKMQMDQDF